MSDITSLPLSFHTPTFVAKVRLAETVGLCFVLTPIVLRWSSSWVSCVCVDHLNRCKTSIR